ncbi:hypothetical protein BKA70DRAFT_1227046 [Coprinopsis sp. MPI-PUGE-AT-0042]|nr:hypothetical protein BKA70DRAFT_1227046 [Coprinopsis sp. MPI-PUGE-AT-0042]
MPPGMQLQGLHMHQAPPKQLYSFLRRIRLSHNDSIKISVGTVARDPSLRQVFHFNSESNDLSPWFWPVYDKNDEAALENEEMENARVTPDDLDEYRRFHIFFAPCCLCAFLDGVRYTESQIVISDEPGRRAFVAECARQRCGYFVRLEEFYPLNGLYSKKFDRRVLPLPRTEFVTREGVFEGPVEKPFIGFRLASQGRKREVNAMDVKADVVARPAKRLCMMKDRGHSRGRLLGHVHPMLPMQAGGSKSKL